MKKPLGCFPYLLFPPYFIDKTEEGENIEAAASHNSKQHFKICLKIENTLRCHVSPLCALSISLIKVKVLYCSLVLFGLCGCLTVAFFSSNVLIMFVFAMKTHSTKSTFSPSHTIVFLFNKTIKTLSNISHYRLYWHSFLQGSTAASQRGC